MTDFQRRDFLKRATAGLTAVGVMLSPRERALAQFQDEKNRLERIASCSWPIRYIFKSRPRPARAAAPPPRSATPAETAQPQTPPRVVNGAGTTERMKATYGEITMLDF